MGKARGAPYSVRRVHWSGFELVFAIATTWLAACSGGGGDGGTLSAQLSSSCMQCHNGTLSGNYSGPGTENPHPFPGAPNIDCSHCHGGNPQGADQLTSHVPPPPEIGDRAQWDVNAYAYFNRLTLAGLDKLPNYQSGGTTYTALDYLQWVNPGDLRVVTQGRGCGTCHAPHAQVVNGSLLATSAGVLSGAMMAVGADNKVPESVGLYEDTAADTGFRAVQDPNAAVAAIGQVLRLIEHPVYSKFGASGGFNIHNNNNEYLAPALSDDIYGATNQVVSNSPLEHLLAEQMAFTCGNCHLGSKGANNRSGDYRSSGCTACHMPYGIGGRAGTSDPYVDKFEPLNPDDINDPELSHPRAHRIVSTKKTMSNGHEMQPMDDHTCAGCHQGSNRTVMQYWGIRLDQNQDVRFGHQYPAQPASSVDTTGDPRLFDPVLGNQEFNGRNRRQYIKFEDYDGDNKDDTPEDVHYAAGLGCIDCHGSFDVHGGDVTNPGAAGIASRMEQAVAIRCESCHGGPDAYATTVAGTDFNGQPAQLAVDANGRVLDHVVRNSDGDMILTSRLTGLEHYISQTRDTIVDTGARHAFSNQLIYSPKASYAMGRVDGNSNTGIGPNQTGGVTPNFAHTDNMDCVSCHGSWTNTCMGCHLEGEYNTGNNFSNITGDRIVFREKNAQFVYQSPVPFQLGVGPRGKITQVSSNTKMFFQWEDKNNTDSEIFAFSDRNGLGNNPAAAFRALAHNAMMPHSIRGKVQPTNEGARYCVSCHLTTDGLASYSAEYDAFRTAMANSDWGALNFNLLKQHIGQNTGNQLNSPLWVHMVAGLGSGLFLFDKDGAAMNPLDNNANRYGSNGTAPANSFVPADVVFNLDRLVETNGTQNSASTHPMLNGDSGLRTGAFNPNLAGPLGGPMVMRLTDPATGIVLDSWLDANGDPHGQAATFMDPGP